MSTRNVCRAPKPFVAWDGEGATVRGRHRYTLFASSCGASIARSGGLRHFDALACLALGMKEYPGIHVGFAIGYDINLMLRGLPRSALQRVWDGERVAFVDRGRRFEVEWRPRKYLKLRFWKGQVRGAWRGPGAGGTWWDVWPFFQTSFVNALEKYDVGLPAERDEIRAMKAERANFTAAHADAIAVYNASECRLLVALMDALRASVTAADLTPSRWDGPGAIATLLLRRHEVTRRTSAPVPEAVLDAAQYAYYGGRIELGHYGTHAGPVYQYDVNSAYPDAMRHLPCRADGCGEWRRTATDWISVAGAEWFALHRVRWAFRRDARFYPFPWRSHTGAVYFPREGEGWVWTPELVAALDTDAGAIRVLDRWAWSSCCAHADEPYGWIARAYEDRQAAKRRGDAAEHAIKLGLNSLYGKLAQRVGGELRADGTHRIPPFHDLAGAGFITSSVRAQLYRAAMLDPEAIVMLATDGVFATRPLALPHDPSKPLGGWDFKTWPGCTVVQSGVYWLHEPDGQHRIYSRGFDADSIEHAAVLDAWARGVPSLDGTQSRFVGLGMSLRGKPSSPAGKAAFQRWCSWVSDPRALTLAPWGTKREPSDRRRNPARGLVPTRPADTSGKWGDPAGRGRMTTPSPVPWRPLVGAEYHDPEARALAESDEAGL